MCVCRHQSVQSCPTSDRTSLNAGWGEYEVSRDAILSAGSSTASAPTLGSSPFQHPHPRDETLQPSTTAIYCHQQPRATYLSLISTVRTPRLSRTIHKLVISQHAIYYFSASLRRTKVWNTLSRSIETTPLSEVCFLRIAFIYLAHCTHCHTICNKILIISSVLNITV